jgi:hypothetical protein
VLIHELVCLAVVQIQRTRIFTPQQHKGFHSSISK